MQIHSKQVLWLIGFVAIGSQSFLCSRYQAVVPSQHDENWRIKHTVNYLASDELEGRGTGSEGEAKAAAYIQEQLQNAGCMPRGENGGWTQAFSFKPHPPVQKHQVGDSTVLGMALVKEITGHNVIGFLDRGKEHTVIVGAHYDHLGWGDENSLWSGERAIHNGADDNASGVAAMLELAHRLSMRKNLKYNYLFIAFSGEEKGLWGSNYFCKHPTVPLNKVNCMLNMDMVGRLNAEHVLAINGVGTSPAWKKILPGIMPETIKQVTTESGVGPSDHASFYNMNIPALHFFTGQHEDYHKPTDDADKVNYAGEALVIDFIWQLILKIEREPRFEFTRTNDESTTTAADFKVTLGVVPDYLFDGEGMRIDGVRDGRPAAKAGLKQGDVVVKIGEYEVKDMMSYMSSLGKFQKGESTVVEILRDGHPQQVTVTWD